MLDYAGERFGSRQDEPTRMVQVAGPVLPGGDDDFAEGAPRNQTTRTFVALAGAREFVTQTRSQLARCDLAAFEVGPGWPNRELAGQPPRYPSGIPTTTTPNSATGSWSMRRRGQARLWRSERMADLL